MTTNHPACPDCARPLPYPSACADDCGWVAHPTVPILLDLIADLRDEHANWDGYCGASLQAADRAEARLRQVTGDE